MYPCKNVFIYYLLSNQTGLKIQSELSAQTAHRHPQGTFAGASG